MGERELLANWYPDPWGPGQLRYWNGKAWTAHLCVPAARAPSATGTLEASSSPTTASATTEHAAEVPIDLSQNRPGALLLAKADELRQAAPFRSFVVRLLRSYTEERAFRVGAEGEMAVAKRLGKLDPVEWRVIHSVPVGSRDSDIDHVVVGPPGVFTLNTKHHPGGKVWVGGHVILINGRRVPYVRNSTFEAQRAARLLQAACGAAVPVRPAIVVIASSLVIREQPHDVHVVSSRTLTRWLKGQPTVLSAAEVAAVYEAARQGTTWRTGALART